MAVRGSSTGCAPVARLRALLGVGVAFLVLFMAGCSGTNPYYDPAKRHHTPQGFTNNYGPPGGKPLLELIRWTYERQRDGLPSVPSKHVDGYQFPLDKPDLAWLAANRTQPSITWIGHATLLVQLAGFNILTDPHFSERAFPVQWMGPRRRVPLPVSLDELPRIDAVVISHSHYDHLDLQTVRALSKQAGGPPRFFVPLGIERWLADQAIHGAQAMDWWEKTTLGNLELTFVPAQHWSARTPFDRNRTLWGGWVLKTDTLSFYFAGDTGYSRDFLDIGERFGGFDVAAIPVGAYLPRWFMKDQHVDPNEAVQIHKDVRSRLSIGIHWGSFELTDEPLDAPIGDLDDARQRMGVSADEFRLLRPGQTIRMTGR